MNYYNEIDPYPAQWLRNLATAGHIPPGTVDERSIADVRADDVVEYTQVHFFAGIGGWPYALRLAGWPDDQPVWTGSCPCFVAGTLILTRNGFRPIETIQVGDDILTHRGRWRPATAIMRSQRTTRLLKGQGHWGLETTDEHPFLTGPDDWTEAKDMEGQRWACLTNIPHMAIPGLEPKTWRGQCQVPDMTHPGFWRFVGYWLGDGWVRDRKQVVICGGHKDGPLLLELAKGARLHGSLSAERTGARLRIGSKLFAAWLDDHFGHGAAEKQIPPWLLSQPVSVLEAFADGLLLADGHEETAIRGGRVRRLTTVSPALAVGARILFNRLGSSATITRSKPTRVCAIEGRVVLERPYYRVTVYARASSFSFTPIAGWGKVRRSVSTGETRDVFNLAVAEDESYTADGIVVHNCQPFSAAGKGLGDKDERHLWPEMFRLIKECRPAIVLGEQVDSVDGRAWFSSVRSDMEDAEYAMGGGIIPAAGVGAPHTRDRIFWVAAHPGRVRGAGFRLARGAGEVRPWGTFGPMDLREIIDRPFDPGTRFSRPRALAISDGIPARVGRLRAYGNAITPQVGAVFVRAVMEALTQEQKET